MNFALCTDENYAKYCAVCIVSILENNRDDVCNIFVLTDRLSFEIKKMFSELSLFYKQKINIVEIDLAIFSNLPVCGRYKLSVYYRFLLPNIINDDKVLYLDCDIIVRKSLKELWYLNITDYACAAVPDQRADLPQMVNRFRLTSVYVNSGVLLINLAYWRKHNVTEKLFKFVKEHKVVWPDQDAINVVLEKKIYLLPFRYNFQYHLYANRDCIEVHFSKWEEIDNYKDNPIICHYTHHHKPWHLDCPHLHVEWFDYYSSIHNCTKVRKTYGDGFVVRCIDFWVKILNWLSKFFR